MQIENEEKNQAAQPGQSIKDNELKADRAVLCVWCGQILYTYNGPPPAEDEAAACLAAARSHEPKCEKSPARDWIVAAVESERERCAKIAETMRPSGGRMWTSEQHACYSALTDCAAAIRATTQPENDRQTTTEESQGSSQPSPDSVLAEIDAHKLGDTYDPEIGNNVYGDPESSLSSVDTPASSSQTDLTLETVLWAAANFISCAPDLRPLDQREVVLKGLGWAIEQFTGIQSLRSEESEQMRSACVRTARDFFEMNSAAFEAKYSATKDQELWEVLESVTSEEGK